MAESSCISVSIIIPVYNEASQLGQSLKKLLQNVQNSKTEIILSDGGSTDNSLSIAKQYPCKIIKSETGRARQMNAAFNHANGDYLLFLHADSRLPDDWLKQIQKSQNWGFFPVRLSGQHWFLRVIETAINFRSRITRVATGDQGIQGIAGSGSAQLPAAPGGLPTTITLSPVGADVPFTVSVTHRVHFAQTNQAPFDADICRIGTQS